jgi:SAM-dependent methyltransferase
MAKLWKTPFYELISANGEKVLIDVTTSISAGLPPNRVMRQKIIPFFHSRDVEKVLDFGAGSLRHTFSLLDAGFEVCAVEFREAFERPASADALERAKRYANFSALIWPNEFIKDTRKFDAAMLNYVLQTMPLASERETVLKYIYRKLKRDAWLLYMSRYNQTKDLDRKYQIEDGYYKWPRRTYHSFYCEFTTERTHQMMKKLLARISVG